MPFTYTYQPLLHYIVASGSALTGLNTPRTFHIVIALFYSAGPVTLFFLARRLSKHFSIALTAAIIYSLWSPSALFIPYIASDIGGVFHAQRLRTIAASGNAPYVAGLTLLPLALLLLDRAIERATPARLLIASLALISVPLTNIPAAMSLAMALGAYCLAAGPGARVRFAAIAIGCLLLGFLLVAPLLPPSSLLLTAQNTQSANPQAQLTPQKFLPVSAGLLFFLAVAWALIGLRTSYYFRFSLLFLLITGAVVLGKVWANVSVIAQPDRFHLVMEMAIALSLASIAPMVQIRNVSLRRAAAAAAVALVCYQVQNYRLYARKLSSGAHPKRVANTKLRIGSNNTRATAESWFTVPLLSR